MSDEEYEYDYGSDQGYDYGSDGGGNDEEGGMADELIEIENAFYEGDDLRVENPSQAIGMFDRVVEMEGRLGDAVKWRFKALQHLVILHFSLGSSDLMVSRYREMLQYLSSVTRNECTDAINAILDALNHTCTNVQTLAEVYEITLVALKSSNNERLWFNTYLKLAKLNLEQEKYTEVDEMIGVLKLSCQRPDGSDDPSLGSILLEVYSLEIQLCSRTRNGVRMRAVYPRTLHLNAAVADPRIMGVIREEGGKMQMAEGNWEDAYNEFYEAFRNYQEAGYSRARDLLKYVVLASMLCLSGINPFAAREAMVYSEDREIVAMRDLRLSLEANDLQRFERTVRSEQNRILDEPFLMTYIQPLRRRMREQVLINLVRPYRKVSLSFLARELSLGEEEIEGMLVEMILDERIRAHIDQTSGHVTLYSHTASASSTSDSIAEAKDKDTVKLLLEWAEALENLSHNFPSRFSQ